MKKAFIILFVVSLSLLGIKNTTYAYYDDAFKFIYPVGHPLKSPTDGNGYSVTQNYNTSYSEGWSQCDGVIKSCSECPDATCYYGHTGVDLANGSAGGLVRAAAGGNVVAIGESGGHGFRVRIQHTLPSGEIVYSQYGHMLNNLLVSNGQDVCMGEPIGYVGSTGFSTAPHLHFEIKDENEDGPGYARNDSSIISKYHNPLNFVSSRLASVPPCRSLGKIESKSEIYWLQNRKAYQVISQQVLTDMAGIPGWNITHVYPEDKLEIIPPGHLIPEGTFKQGPDFISTSLDSNGMLIKLTIDPKVYLIENGKSRWVTSEAFSNLGFDFNDVIVVSQSIFDIFSEGNPITEGLTISWTTQWRSYRGVNSIDWSTGDRLTMSVGLDPVQTINGQTDVVATNLDTGYSHSFFYIGNPVYNPLEFAQSIEYDPAKTGDWLVTATNGPDTATAYIPAIGDVELLPPLRNVQIIGSGFTPTISWTVPAGTGADRVVIQVIDDILNIRLWRSRNLQIGLTQFTIPDGILDYGHPYVIAARLEDTVTNTIYGFDKSRATSFFNFTPLEEGEPQAVYLPTVGEDPDPTDEFGASYTFDIDVEVGVPCFIDPFVAIGYDYAIGEEDTIKFASVTLPEIGDNLFDLYLFDGSIFYLAQKNLGAGVTYNFGPNGVEKFRILGIEEDAQLDPLDVTAFITEITFTDTSKFTGTMTPITAYPSTVDFDPDTLNLKSKGKFVTCYIELPETYDPNFIDLGSITLGINGTLISPQSSPTEIGDYDSDGIPDMMIKFDRGAVQDASTLGEMEIKISGSMLGYQEYFQGTDTIFVK